MRQRGLCAAEVRESARARVYNSSRDTLRDIKLLTSQRNEVKSYHYKIIAFGLVRDRRTKELIVSKEQEMRKPAHKHADLHWHLISSGKI